MAGCADRACPNSLAVGSAGNAHDVKTLVLRKLQIRNGRISVGRLKGLEDRPLPLVAEALAPIDRAAGANVANGDDGSEKPKRDKWQKKNARFGCHSGLCI